jgi:DNA polymerase III epsilon subunit-like protein
MDEIRKYLPYKDQFAICFDWETTGSDFAITDMREMAKVFQGISLGAVVYDTATMEPVDSMYVEIKFDAAKYQWLDRAEKIHGLSRAHLEANGATNEEAASMFFEMFLKYFSPESQVLVLSHNTNFDIAFMEQLLEPLGIMFKIKRTVLDTSVLGYMTTGLHKSDDLFDFLCIPPRTEHNALEDALYTLEAAKRIRDIFQLGLSG